MKTLTGRLLAFPVLCVALIFLLLFALLDPGIKRLACARFLSQGPDTARTLTVACRPAHINDSPRLVQSALERVSRSPDVAWVLVTAPDGRIIAQTPRSAFPASLARHLRAAGGDWIAASMPGSRLPVSVFRKQVALGVIGMVFVGLDRSRLAGTTRTMEGIVLASLAAVGLLILAAFVRTVRRAVAPIRLLTQWATQAGDDPQTRPGPIPVWGGEWEALAAACQTMAASLRHRPEAHSSEGRCLAEASYRSMFENAPDGIWQTTPDGKCLAMNPSLARIYGYDSAVEYQQANSHVGQQPYADPERRAEYRRLMRDEGGVTHFESQVRRRDGQVIWISENARAVRDRSGVAVCYEGTVEDITARKRAEADRAHLANYLRLLLESSGEGIYGVDFQGNCTFINRAAARMLGYETGDVLGRDMHALIHHSHADGSRRPPELSPIHRSFHTGQPRHVDDEVLWRRDGTAFASEYTTSPIVENGRIIGAVVNFVDISIRKAMEAEQQRLLAEALERADHDPLTSLVNHRAFHKRLDEEADRSVRSGTTLAVALLDLNNFKFFNDVYGHRVGDEVLRQVADALRNGCRSYDTIARFGGDEFALLMPCAGEETAADVWALLNERLSAISYCPEGNDQAIPLSLSIGVAVFPQEGATRLDTLELADARLRRAKTGGDEDGMTERVRASLTRSMEGFSMLDALVTAVDNKDRYTRRHSEDVMRYCLEIARQMQIDEKTQRILEVAALVHDVGKIGVPDYILRKPGQLSEEEFGAIKQHPLMGAALAESLPGFEETLDAIRHHHERWDGGGYPFGLHGEEIPPLARLMAVADAFSAMTTDRPYRKGMDVSRALAILEQGAGVQWDPCYVDAFRQARQPEAAPVA